MSFDKNFFEKHQSVLLRLARSKWTRWLLGINRLPKDIKDKALCKITPNSVHWPELRTGKGKQAFTGIFFVRPRFAEALAHSLSPFAYLSLNRILWRQFSPVGAVVIALAAIFPRVGFLGLMATVTDFYVANGGAGDGTTQNGSLTAGQTWTNCRNGTGGTLFVDATRTTWSDTNNGYGCGRFKDGNSRWWINRDHCPIETSALTSGAVISAAILKLVPDSVNSGGGDSIVIVQSTAASNTALATSDFTQVGFTAWSDTHTFAGLSTGSYMDFTFNASGLAGISKTSFSKFCLMTVADQTNAEPGAGTLSRVNMRSSRYAGTTSDPYLQVTYTNATIVTPSTLAIEATLQAPTIRFDKILSVSALGLEATLQSPSIEILQLFEPDSLAMEASLFPPSLLLDNRFSVGTLGAELSVQSPSVTGGTVVPVDNFAIEASVFSPTFSIGWTVFPDALEIVATLELISSRWSPRIKPSSSWSDRTKPTSIWTVRTPPTTNWI